MKTFYKNKIEHSYLGGYCEIDKEKKSVVKIDEHIKYRILQIIKREFDRASRKIMQVCNIINEQGNKKPFRFFTQKLGQVHMRSKIQKINNMAVFGVFLW